MMRNIFSIKLRRYVNNNIKLIAWTIYKLETKAIAVKLSVKLQLDISILLYFLYISTSLHNNFKAINKVYINAHQYGVQYYPSIYIIAVHVT